MRVTRHWAGRLLPGPRLQHHGQVLRQPVRRVRGHHGQQRLHLQDALRARLQDGRHRGGRCHPHRGVQHWLLHLLHADSLLELQLDTDGTDIHLLVSVTYCFFFLWKYNISIIKVKSVPPPDLKQEEEHLLSIVVILQLSLSRLKTPIFVIIGVKVV